MPDITRPIVSVEGEILQDSAINPADIRLAAMNLLARREHAFAELHKKLLRRFADETLVHAELQRLADENLQSDERFAESFIRQRSSRGYGPGRIRQEMRDRGLCDQEIASAFAVEAPNWHDIAIRAYEKKFGRRAIDDLKEKSRRVRFMQYRGFEPDHYQDLLSD